MHAYLHAHLHMYSICTHTASNPTQLHGMGFFLALNALNFAEADRPFNRLSGKQLAEMYFATGLQCHVSIPYGASVPMVSLHFVLQSCLLSRLVVNSRPNYAILL